MTDWYESLSGEVRGVIDGRLEYLQARPRHEWIRPRFDLLSGSCSGLGEVIIKAASGQYRILGHFGPERLEFTMLVGFKKQRDSDYQTACKLAHSRWKEIEENVQRAIIASFP